MTARRTAAIAASVISAFVLVGSALPAVATAGTTAHATYPCSPLFASDLHGATGALALRAHAVPATESRGKSTAQLQRLLATDPTFYVDRCGHPYYRDVPLPQSLVSSGHTGGAQPSLVPPFPLSQTFLLNSRPGSRRTIYLNFVGRTMTQTAWNVQAYWTMPQGYRVAPYDTDGNLATFSTDEQAVIQSVWQRVSEDYATFDVNVTTQPPALAAIDRNGPADQVYGTEAVITSDAALASGCGCGGIAWLGAFALTSQHAAYQPALVFESNLGDGTTPKFLAEAAAHEVGHTFGLTHDGTTLDEYYTPHPPNEWAPIMGASYYVPVTQWSKGEYPDANNTTQDDLADIAKGGAPALVDTVGNTLGTASQMSGALIVSGLVNNASDSDWYSFAGSGPVTITANPSSVSPDLDIALSLYDGSGNLVATSNPPVAEVDGDVASGLNASISTTLAAGTYYVKVAGTGFGTPGTDMYYSNYASIGPFTLSIAMNQPAIEHVALALAFIGQPYSHTLIVAGGTGPYVWALTSGSLPDGVTLNAATGELSGTPTTSGTSMFTVQVTDANNAIDTRDLSLTVTDTATLPSAPQAVQLTPSVRSVLVQWTAPASAGSSAIDSYTATAQPGGQTCSSGTSDTFCTISGLANGTTYTIRVTAHNAVGTGIESNFAQATTFTVPTAPTGISAEPHNKSVLVSWYDSDGGSAPVTSYTATATPGGQSCLAPNSNGCTLAGLTNGTLYTVTVFATNDVGNSALSDPSVAFRPYTSPGSPTAVRAASLPGGLRVSWRAPDGGGYPITMYQAIASPGLLACRSTGPTACIIRGLTNGVAYRVVVSAMTNHGNSLPSVSSNRAIPLLTPSVSATVRPVLAVAHGATVTFKATIRGAGNLKTLKPWCQRLQGKTWSTIPTTQVRVQKVASNVWRVSVTVTKSLTMRLVVPASKSSKSATSRTFTVRTR